MVKNERSFEGNTRTASRACSEGYTAEVQPCQPHMSPGWTSQRYELNSTLAPINRTTAVGFNAKAAVSNPHLILFRPSNSLSLRISNYQVHHPSSKPKFGFFLYKVFPFHRTWQVCGAFKLADGCKSTDLKVLLSWAQQSPSNRYWKLCVGNLSHMPASSSSCWFQSNKLMYLKLNQQLTMVAPGKQK